MSSPSVMLYRLRGIFVVYFVLKSIAGAVVAFSVMKPYAVLRGGSPASLAVFSLVMAGMILLLAWLIFGQLLQRKNWARVLLLVVGWLTVLSAVFSLLALSPGSGLSSWVARLVPEMELDWGKLMRYDRAQKIFELLFWGYLISVLQFNNSVRDWFFPQEPVEKSREN